MASGHVNRMNRPNTRPHRPKLRREVFPCQRGAAHTWRISNTAALQNIVGARSEADAKRNCERDPNAGKRPCIVIDVS